MKLRILGCVATVLVGMAPAVQAGVIYSATGGVINSGGPGFGTLTETYNQAGLSAGYVSGVTDFNTYIASNPTHTTIFSGFEWFSNSGTSSASVTYDLGVARTIDAMALWNEESSGIGLLDLFTSMDGVNFSLLATGLVPTDHFLTDYLADVFSFSAVTTRYMRLDMSRCPQPNSASFDACAIGEVAFRGADVPEPGTLALLGLGLAGLGLSRRRKAN